MESFPILLMVAHLCAAGGGGPLIRAKTSQAVASPIPWARSIGAGSTQPHPPLPHAAQSPAPSMSHSPRGVSGFFHAWSQMAQRTEAEQPDWLSPVATTTGRLKDEMRIDAWRPISPSSQAYYNLAGGKGLEFIVAPRLQLLLGIPSYMDYPNSGRRDGFGDMPLMMKIRVASAPRKEGDYLFTILLKATVPTGSNAAGMHAAVLTPGIAVGKGWKQFDVQSTLGSNLPLGDTAILGRQFLWDTAFQYRVRKKLWPELEVNSVHYLMGKYAGETQAFLTPGLGFGRAHLCGPVSISAGVGFQIAATEFHTYNHQLMLSVRFPF